MAQDSAPGTPVTPADVANASALNEAVSQIRTMLAADSTALLAILASLTTQVGTTGLGVLRLKPTLFASLPSSPAAGWVAYVTNSTTATWGATIAGGGANKVLAWYNGAGHWTVIGA